MARCGCAANGEACACLIVNGSNTTVTGDGSATTPYKINVAVASVVLQVQDSASIDLSLAGLGTPASPWVLSADRIGFGTSADYTTVYAALRSMGMPQAAAILLSKAIGPTPGVDPELNVKPMTISSGSATFSHSIVAATGVYEKVTEVPDITVQESGLYQINWRAHGQISLPANTAGTGQSASTNVGIFKNAALVGATETKVAHFVLGGSPSIALPGHGIYTTGAGESYQTLNAGDVISLYAKRVTGIASTHTIESNADGRSMIELQRVRPA